MVFMNRSISILIVIIISINYFILRIASTFQKTHYWLIFIPKIIRIFYFILRLNYQLPFGFAIYPDASKPKIGVVPKND